MILVFHALDRCYQCTDIGVGWPTVSHPLDRVGTVGVDGYDPPGAAGGGDVDGYRRGK